VTSPIVSIVIPCYNAEKWIAEAIQSALDQDYRNCEVIVIDDGSTDSSLIAIKSFGDKVRWVSGANLGGCAARNRGIDLSQGEWIQFLDADDVLTADCIEAKVNADLPEGVLPCTQVAFMPDSDLSLLSSKWTRTEYDFATMVLHTTPPTPAPLHRKQDLVRIGGFRPGLPCSQEYDLHLRLAIQIGLKFHVIPVVGALIRPRPDSVSKRNGAPILATRVAILRHILGAEDLRARLSRDQVDIIAQAMTGFARAMWRNGDREEAERLASEARAVSSRWLRTSHRSVLARSFVSIFGFCNFERAHAILSGASRNSG